MNLYCFTCKGKCRLEGIDWSKIAKELMNGALLERDAGGTYSR
jgi:hypothetical protein